MTLGADIGYGDAYGDTTELPFFENFYVGGPRSIRGYKENTIGPRDNTRRAIGGSTKIIGNAELILPVPFLEDFKQARISGFFDAGNVYGPDEDIEFEKIGMNPFNSPIPGQSLTVPQETRHAWESPPRYTTVEPVLKELFLQITEKETYIELLNLLNNGTPIDQLTQVILYRGMTEGIYNVDLMLLLIEPTMYLLIAIAEENEIEPVIYEEQDDDLAETETVQKQIRNKKQSEIRKDSVPSSILQRVKTLPKLDELQTEEEVG